MYVKRKEKHSIFLNQKGFTLPEILMVMVIIGLLGLVATNSLKGAIPTSKAVTAENSCEKSLDNWILLCEQIGIAIEPSDSNPAIDTNKSALDILYEGGDSLAADYEDGYKYSNVALLDRIAVKSGSTWKISGFVAAMNYDSSAGELSLSLAKVPTELVKRTWTKRMSGTFDPNTASTTGSVRYTANSGGTHTLTFVRGL